MSSPSKSPNTESNSTLYLVGIPTEENTILELCNYFGKFGKVLNVEVAPNGDPSASKVTFASNEEASAAFDSPQAVLNNRFIKMSWNSSQANAAAASMAKASGDKGDDTKCSLCKRTFASKWHRDWHIKRMHNGSGIVCDICNATFTSTSTYKKHCIVQHPIMRNGSPKNTLKYERSPLKIDQFALAREIELLRIKIKTLKDNLKEIEKSHSKELKKKKKRFVEQLKEKDDSLKEKDAVFATMEQKITMLETTNTRLMQDLQNGRLEVKMLHETLVRVCGGRNQNGV